MISTEVVQPDETESLNIVEGKDLVTLVTCTPLGVNSHRILVTGERIYSTPEEDIEAATESPSVPTFPYWVFAIAGAIVLSGVWMWRSGLQPTDGIVEDTPEGEIGNDRGKGGD